MEFLAAILIPNRKAQKRRLAHNPNQARYEVVYEGMTYCKTLL